MTVRRLLVLVCASLLAVIGVAGIVKYQNSPSGIAFHAIVLLCAGYLATTAIRRA